MGFGSSKGTHDAGRHDGRLVVALMYSPIAPFYKAATKRLMHGVQEPEQSARGYVKLSTDLGL
jgi:hypothetical protein